MPFTSEIENIYADIRYYCNKNADADILLKSQHYFKEPFVGYGLRAQQLWDKTKLVLKSHKLTPDNAIDLVEMFFPDKMHEEITIALLILAGLSKQYTKEHLKKIESFFSFGITNWAHADALASYILPQFINREIVSHTFFGKWMKSEYKFQRRCVPVSFIKPMKVDKKCKIYIDAVEPLMKDEAREVHQGVGWFLREAWKIDPVYTEDFLFRWKDFAPRLLIRYACEKMMTNKRVLFRRS